MLKQRLEEALLARYEDIGARYAKRYVGKYVDEVMAELAVRFMQLSSGELNDGEMNFAVAKVARASGRCKTLGKTEYVYSLMKQHPTTALVIETYTGNSITHRLSRVIINPLYKRDVLQALADVTVQCSEEEQQALQAKSNMKVQIDPYSLASYIEQTRSTLQRDDLDKPYEEKLHRNLQAARRVLALAYEEEGKCYVDEYWEQIDSGRQHGHGMSLQRVAKEVRHAALGTCYRYDFKAASYALMTSLARVIDPTIKTAALQEYVKKRSVIRKRIAQDIGVSEGLMKEIFTAMGFGAELKDNPYNVIRDVLGKERFNLLLCNAEFMQISMQLQNVSRTILAERGEGDFEWLGRTYTEINPKDGKKRTKNQKLAWIYQCMESHALQLFTHMIPQTYQIKLQVHDCLYLDRPLALHHEVDIRYALAQHYPLLNFEGEGIKPIHAVGYVSKADSEYAQQQAQHKALIAQQERLAEELYAQGQPLSLAA